MKLRLKLMIILTFFSGAAGAQDVQLVLDAKATLGEGALWHPVEQKLYWVDIEGKQLHIYDPSTGEDRRLPTPGKIGTVVPVRTGEALVALQDGIYKMNTSTGEMDFLVNAEKDSAIRYNDGKCDPAGRFWVGTMAGHEEAALYRVDPDGRIHLLLDSVTCSNGIVWSADKKTMYYVDTPTMTVMAFGYDNATGNISHPRVAVKVPPGMGAPDGMTIDEDGKLWIAHWGGSCVARWDPLTGELLQKISVPGPHTTSCAFGGENLDILYITTARDGLSEEQLRDYPLSGGLFAVKPGVRGVPAEFFGEK
ncbi:SMP-30/gluconolactonase/LRE family protein [Anseongella ginsenosidimutans]|nr:SMP-30/gluconolactonase/LRE family protein [Anseongella ginsenosidimutans]